MSRLSFLSFTTSATLHAAVLVLLGVRFAAPQMERPEIAGDRVVISSVLTASAPSALRPHEVELATSDTFRPTPDTPPQSEPGAAEPASHESPAAQANDDKSRRKPERLSLSRARSEPPVATAVPERQPWSPPGRQTNVDADEPAFKRPPTPEREVTIEPARNPPTPQFAPVPDVTQDIVEPPAPTTPQQAGTIPTKPARPLRNPHPVYPADAVRNRQQGVVLLRVTIAASGSVTRVTIDRSSGHRQLDQAARDAVLQWQFAPATRDGQAVEWTARLPVRFRLN